MWLATPIGFYSAVAMKDGDPDVLQVRTRARADALALAKWLVDGNLVELDEVNYPTVESMVIGKLDRYQDYPYRVYVWREHWAQFAAWSATTITYTNFKSEVQKINPQREHTYHGVWSAYKRIEGEHLRKTSQWVGSGFRPQRPQGTLMDLLGTTEVANESVGSVRLGQAFMAHESDERCKGCDKFLDKCINKGLCPDDEDLSVLAEQDASAILLSDQLWLDRQLRERP